MELHSIEPWPKNVLIYQKLLDLPCMEAVQLFKAVRILLPDKVSFLGATSI
jgi:hypothetical protein